MTEFVFPWYWQMYVFLTEPSHNLHSHHAQKRNIMKRNSTIYYWWSDFITSNRIILWYFTSGLMGFRVCFPVTFSQSLYEVNPNLSFGTFCFFYLFIFLYLFPQKIVPVLSFCILLIFLWLFSNLSVMWCLFWSLKVFMYYIFSSTAFFFVYSFLRIASKSGPLIYLSLFCL